MPRKKKCILHCLDTFKECGLAFANVLVDLKAPEFWLAAMKRDK